jgi:hypothetical protein
MSLLIGIATSLPVSAPAQSDREVDPASLSSDSGISVKLKGSVRGAAGSPARLSRCRESDGRRVLGGPDAARIPRRRSLLAAVAQRRRLRLPFPQRLQWIEASAR